VVALTGIEPAGRRYSSVQVGLSSCVFGPVQFATRAFRAVQVADVLPRCCPATEFDCIIIIGIIGLDAGVFAVHRAADAVAPSLQ
jgi:hypothetical protein